VSALAGPGRIAMPLFDQPSNSTPRGYDRGDLEDVWPRYLPTSPAGSATSATPQHGALTSRTPTRRYGGPRRDHRHEPHHLAAPSRMPARGELRPLPLAVAALVRAGHLVAVSPGTYRRAPRTPHQPTHPKEQP